ncbi:MAG TPA: 3-isopropylmalate dehydrogenase [Stellaceae bacterium]|nr:3-isopropylmalate dehydrogenase [Stellaceae bacterium]
MTETIRRLVLLGGDGIGPEVIAETRRVIDWFARHRGLAVAVSEAPFGLEAWRRHGKILPEATMAEIMAADAVLFGARGGPGYEAIPPAEVKAGSLLRLRRTLDVFANFRPLFAIPALFGASSLKDRVLEGVDLVIVRELTGGIYFGEPRGIERLPDGTRVGVNTHRYTSAEIRRVAGAAFDLARRRRRRVCSVDKSNVMEAGALWREEVTALHREAFSEVELSHMLADNCAMQLVRAPGQFDVILTDNLFGDLLSDCGAMIMGSLGMLPSASLGAADAAGRRRALYEPVHGSAPDIAGQGIANPLGAILSFAMALRLTFERPAEAKLLEDAVAAALASGVRTADIMEAGARRVTTAEMGSAVLASLSRLLT